MREQLPKDSKKRSGNRTRMIIMRFLHAMLVTWAKVFIYIYMIYVPVFMNNPQILRLRFPFFDEKSNIPLEHTPELKHVFMKEILSYVDLWGTWVLFQGSVGISLDCYMFWIVIAETKTVSLTHSTLPLTYLPRLPSYQIRCRVFLQDHPLQGVSTMSWERNRSSKIIGATVQWRCKNPSLILTGQPGFTLVELARPEFQLAGRVTRHRAGLLPKSVPVGSTTAARETSHFCGWVSDVFANGGADGLICATVPALPCLQLFVGLLLSCTKRSWS